MVLSTGTSSQTLDLQSFAMDLIQPLAARNNKRFFDCLLWQIDSAETKLVDGD